MRSLALAAALSLLIVPAAYAKATQCHDAKGHFAKCPAAASAAASAPASPTKSAPASAMASTAEKAGYNSGGGHPNCSKGKPCGNACIAMNKTCHK